MPSARQHDDGAKGDGLFGNWYTAVNQAIIVLPGDEGVIEPEPNPNNMPSST